MKKNRLNYMTTIVAWLIRSYYSYSQRQVKLPISVKYFQSILNLKSIQKSSESIEKNTVLW